MSGNMVNNVVFRERQEYMYILQDAETLIRRLKEENNGDLDSRIREAREIRDTAFAGLLRCGLECTYTDGEPVKARLMLNGIEYLCKRDTLAEILGEDAESILGVKCPDKKPDETVKENTDGTLDEKDITEDAGEIESKTETTVTKEKTKEDTLKTSETLNMKDETAEESVSELEDAPDSAFEPEPEPESETEISSDTNPGQETENKQEDTDFVLNKNEDGDRKTETETETETESESKPEPAEEAEISEDNEAETETEIKTELKKESETIQEVKQEVKTETENEIDGAGNKTGTEINADSVKNPQTEEKAETVIPAPAPNPAPAPVPQKPVIHELDYQNRYQKEKPADTFVYEKLALKTEQGQTECFVFPLRLYENEPKPEFAVITAKADRVQEVLLPDENNCVHIKPAASTGTSASADGMELLVKTSFIRGKFKTSVFEKSGARTGFSVTLLKGAYCHDARAGYGHVCYEAEPGTEMHVLPVSEKNDMTGNASAVVCIREKETGTVKVLDGAEKKIQAGGREMEILNYWRDGALVSELLDF